MRKTKVGRLFLATCLGSFFILILYFQNSARSGKYIYLSIYRLCPSLLNLLNITIGFKFSQSVASDSYLDSQFFFYSASENQVTRVVILSEMINVAYGNPRLKGVTTLGLSIQLFPPEVGPTFAF